MMKKIGAVVAGLAAFAVVAFLFWLAVHATWPAYVLAEPKRIYALEMLLARQTVGMIATLAAGAAAAWVSRESEQTVAMTGAVMLLIAVVWHIRIWDQYPVWYHLLLFLYLVPLAILGGRLAKRSSATHLA